MPILYAAPLRAPKWYKCPVGASFGFGACMLMWFRPRPSAAGVPAGGSEVSLLVSLCSFGMVLFVHFSLFVQVFVHNLVTEDSLFSRSSEFEAAIQNGERSLLRVLCDKKSQESEYVIFAGH